MIIVTAGDLTVLTGTGGTLPGRKRLPRGVDVLPIETRAPGATGDGAGGGVIEPTHVIRTSRAAIARSQWERIITN